MGGGGSTAGAGEQRTQKGELPDEGEEFESLVTRDEQERESLDWTDRYSRKESENWGFGGGLQQPIVCIKKFFVFLFLVLT